MLSGSTVELSHVSTLGFVAGLVSLKFLSIEQLLRSSRVDLARQARIVFVLTLPIGTWASSGAVPCRRASLQWNAREMSFRHCVLFLHLLTSSLRPLCKTAAYSPKRCPRSSCWDVFAALVVLWLQALEFQF